MMIFLDTGCCGVGLGSFGRIVELRFDETKDGNELSLLVSTAQFGVRASVLWIIDTHSEWPVLECGEEVCQS